MLFLLQPQLLVTEELWEAMWFLVTGKIQQVMTCKNSQFYGDRCEHPHAVGTIDSETFVSERVSEKVSSLA